MRLKQSVSAGVLLGLALSLCQCVHPGGGEAVLGPTPAVKRSAVLAMAERYLNHAWVGEARHAYHGMDADGQRVDTPDATFRPEGRVPGWWQPGKVNHGVPYCWGGRDTPESFDHALQQGKYAGDVYSEQKRAGLEGAVSKHTTGVDCSGFVSRCWGLDWHCSTRTLPRICHELSRYEDLKPGDALSVYNAHVLLFEQFTDASRTMMMVYETGSPLGWKVTRHTVPSTFLKGQGYKPYRYRSIQEG